MKCRIKSANSILCPKCKKRIKRLGKDFRCKACGYVQREEEDSVEKRFWNYDYSRPYSIW
jgi:tRNA(Ile2) C34 agmatinyltransferase TiaS